MSPRPLVADTARPSLGKTDGEVNTVLALVPDAVQLPRLEGKNLKQMGQDRMTTTWVQFVVLAKTGFETYHQMPPNANVVSSKSQTFTIL